MFFRVKKVGALRYLQLVENRREGKHTRQRLLATLGQVDKLAASGAVDVLLRSLARFAPQGRPDVGGTLRRGLDIVGVRLGPGLLLQPLWQQIGLAALPDGSSSGKEPSLSRGHVLFLAVLRRLFGPETGRPGGASVPEAAGVAQRQLDQSLLWLACNLPDVEDHLARRRRDTVSPGRMAFLHAVAAHLVGRAPSDPDSPKIDRLDASEGVATVLHTEGGAPLACRLWPSAGTRRPIARQELERLGRRFDNPSFCCVGDWALARALGASGPQAAQPPYLIGGPVRRMPMQLFRALRQAGHLQSFADDFKEKEIDVDGERHVILRDAREAAQDAADHEDVLRALVERESGGIRVPADDPAYEQMLMTGIESPNDRPDERREASYYGLYVMRTNTDLAVAEVVAQHRWLRRVEEFLRVIDSPREGRPAALLHGRVAVSFLGLLLVDELQRRLAAHGVGLAWRELRAELASLAELEISDGVQNRLMRAPISEVLGAIIQALGVAPPSE